MRPQGAQIRHKGAQIKHRGAQIKHRGHRLGTGGTDQAQGAQLRYRRAQFRYRRAQVSHGGHRRALFRTGGHGPDPRFLSGQRAAGSSSPVSAGTVVGRGSAPSMPRGASPAATVQTARFCLHHLCQPGPVRPQPQESESVALDFPPVSCPEGRGAAGGSGPPVPAEWAHSSRDVYGQGCACSRQ